MYNGPVLNWVEIDAPALRHNLGVFRDRLAAGTRLGAVVKSNAYGHGAAEIARIAVDAGADWLCVNHVDEGVRLREAGHRLPVLVMGYTPLDRLADVVAHDLRPVVYDRAPLERLAEEARRAGRRVPVHVKVETGTHRQGVPEADVPGLAARIAELDGVVLEGLSTHFANIEDTTDHRYAESQLARFRAVDEALCAAGHRPAIRHTACSAAALLLERTHLDLARVGIGLYGVWPSRETLVSCREAAPGVELRPVMTWKTRVAQVRDVPEGAFVGYGCTYRTTRPSRIAVLPVGYHEGYRRALSGVAHVLVGGRRAPVRGRVCMNMTMVDVTDVPGVGAEAEVVLLGAQGEDRISAEQLAAWCGTIPYEALTGVHGGLPRVVIDGADR